MLNNTGKFKLSASALILQWLWIAFYGGVNRVNFVPDNMDKITFTNESYKNRLKGEALFLRGPNIFYLVSIFNNVPLITKF